MRAIFARAVCIFLEEMEDFPRTAWTRNHLKVIYFQILNFHNCSSLKLRMERTGEGDVISHRPTQNCPSTILFPDIISKGHELPSHPRDHLREGL